MGTRAELQRLVQFLLATGVRPEIDSVLSLEDAAKGLRRMHDGAATGKIVFRH
jgi:D-arabinose 1-dehydrogenase-like Zn-dependent alcohol dehydrogenase